MSTQKREQTDAQIVAKALAGHTPGPWGYEKDFRGTWSIVDLRSDNHDVLAVIDDENTRAELGQSAIANARLIALSPALYDFAALVARMKTEEEFGDDAPPSEDWISTLNDLIAQARKLCAKTGGREA